MSGYPWLSMVTSGYWGYEWLSMLSMVTGGYPWLPMVTSGYWLPMAMSNK